MNAETQNRFKLASQGRRIAAIAIDHFTFSFLMVFSIFLGMGNDFMDHADPNRLAIVIAAVMLPGFCIYFAKDFIKGVSLGKWVMGIRVCDASDPNRTPSLGRLFLRNLYIIIWPVELIVFLSSSDSKRLGDRSAKTAVVESSSKPPKLIRILPLIGLFIAFFIALSFFVGSAMKNSEAYLIAKESLRQDKTVQAETGGIVGFGETPGGSILIENGTGTADLHIKVLGKQKDVSVWVHMEMRPNRIWEIVDIDL